MIVKSHLVRLLALATFLVTISLTIFGQTTATAPLSGSVLDQNGAVVSGASVTSSSLAASTSNLVSPGCWGGAQPETALLPIFALTY